MTKKLIPFAFFSLLIIASCGKSNSAFDAGNALTGAFESKDIASEESPPAMDETVKFSAPNVSEDKEAGSANASGTGITSTTSSASVPVKMAEKIKKTADIDIEVQEYNVARAAIDKIVKSGNAYISGENEQNSTYSISNSIVIRVANKDFDALVSNLAGVASHVNSKNIYMEDVSAEFVDITARLKTKKEVEKRYIDLLQKAVNVSDILEVEEQLRVIREEIEAKEGQLKLLNDQVAYSTVNLNFHQNFEYTPQDEPGFFGCMGHAFGNGWKGFLSFLIGLAYVWPLWLILGLTTYFLVKFIKRKMKK